MFILATVGLSACDLNEVATAPTVEAPTTRSEYYEQPQFRAFSGTLSSRRQHNTARIGQHTLGDFSFSHDNGPINGLKLWGVILENGDVVSTEQLDIIEHHGSQGALVITNSYNDILFEPEHFTNSRWWFTLERTIEDPREFPNAEPELQTWLLPISLVDVKQVDLLPTNDSKYIYTYTFLVDRSYWEAYLSDIRSYGDCDFYDSECLRSTDCSLTEVSCRTLAITEAEEHGDQDLLQEQLLACETKYSQCMDRPIDSDPFLCDQDVHDDGDLVYHGNVIEFPTIPESGYLNPVKGFQAVFYEDIEVNYTTGEIHNEQDRVHLGCLSGATGKAATWGYPAASGLDKMEAATRVIRADYCADGTSHTVDGTPLYMGDDNFSLPANSGQNPHKWEADWNFDGARRVYHTRDGSDPGNYDNCLSTSWNLFALTDLAP